MIILPIFSKAVRVHALKGLALPQAWDAGDVSLTGQSRQSNSRAAVPLLSVHAFVTETKIGRIFSPSLRPALVL
jgi:hypothetical protein